MSDHPPRHVPPTDAHLFAEAVATRARARALFFGRVTRLAVIAILVAILCLLLYVVILIRFGQVTNAPKIDNTERAATAANKVLRKVKSCTTPGEKCFQAAQRRSAALVGGLNGYAAAASAAATLCADDPALDTFLERYECTRENADKVLKQQQSAQPPPGVR